MLEFYKVDLLKYKEGFFFFLFHFKNLKMTPEI